MGRRIPVTLGNIAPLSLRPLQPGQITLVRGGGGRRGISTAGVLDESMRAQFSPFDLYPGTSAEAQDLSTFICNQPGYAHKVIMRYTIRRESFGPLRFVRGGDPIDLGWLVEATANQMSSQMDTVVWLFDSGKPFYVRACRQGGYAPNYFLPTKQNWLDMIHASNAVPGLYRSEVSLKGINCLDDGISDAIPVKETAKQGAKTLVVIHTASLQMYYMPQWFKRMERWLGDSSLRPLVNLVQHHRTSYCGIQQFIEKPPGKLRVFEIYLPRPLHSIVLGSRIPALREDYKLGRLCGRHFLVMVGKLLAEKTPLTHHLVPVMTSESIVIPLVPAINDTLVAEVSDAPQVNDPTFNNEDLA